MTISVAPDTAQKIRVLVERNGQPAFECSYARSGDRLVGVGSLLLSSPPEMVEVNDAITLALEQISMGR